MKSRYSLPATLIVIPLLAGGLFRASKALAAVEFSSGVLGAYAAGANQTGTLAVTTTGTNRVAFVWVNTALITNVNVTSVTIGTASGTYTGLSGAGAVGSYGASYLWQVINPPTGSQTVTISGETASRGFVASVYSGANQTTPVNASYSKHGPNSNGGSVNVTSTVAGTMIVAGVSEGAGTPVAAAPTVARFTSGSGYGQFDNGSASSTAGVDKIVNSSFGGSSVHDFLAVQIAPAAAAAAPEVTLPPTNISGGVSFSAGAMGL